MERIARYTRWQARRGLAVVSGLAAATLLTFVAPSTPSHAQRLILADVTQLEPIRLEVTRLPITGPLGGIRTLVPVTLTHTVPPIVTRTLGPIVTRTPVPSIVTAIPTITPPEPADPVSDPGIAPATPLPPITPTPAEITPQPTSSRTPVPQQTVGVSDAPVVWGTPVPEEISTGGTNQETPASTRSPTPRGAGAGNASGTPSNGGSSVEPSQPSDGGDADAPTSVAPAPTNRAARGASGAPATSQPGLGQPINAPSPADDAGPAGDPAGNAADEPTDQASDLEFGSPEESEGCGTACSDVVPEAAQTPPAAPGVSIAPMGSSGAPSR